MTCLLDWTAAASSAAQGPESSESGEITKTNFSLRAIAVAISDSYGALNGTTAWS